MLLQQGSMDAVNLLVEREHLQECEEDTEGGWHTEGSLKLLPGWDTHLVWTTRKSTKPMMPHQSGFTPLTVRVRSIVGWWSIGKYVLSYFAHSILEYMNRSGIWSKTRSIGQNPKNWWEPTRSMELKSTVCLLSRSLITKTNKPPVPQPPVKLNCRTSIASLSCVFFPLIGAWSPPCLCRMLEGCLRMNPWNYLPISSWWTIADHFGVGVHTWFSNYTQIKLIGIVGHASQERVCGDWWSFAWASTWWKGYVSSFAIWAMSCK